MAVLKILVYPNPILRKKSVPVDKIDKETEKLLDDMAETMYDAPGVGLAAPQIGVNLRVIVVDVSPKDENSPGLIELINPEIISSESEQWGEEGCLSIPGFVAIFYARLFARTARYEISTSSGLMRPFFAEFS